MPSFRQDLPAAPSLDPGDWSAFRAQAHAALDTCLDHLQSVAEGPVWRPVPDSVKAFFAAPVPTEGMALEQLLEDCRSAVMPYATGNLHPRFFGWAHGAGAPVGIVAEMIAATLNANCGGRDHGAIYVERQVLDWCRAIFGLPVGTSGVLTVGTSMASVIAVAAARGRALGGTGEAEEGGAASRLVGYCSTQVHVALKKAFKLLGFAQRQLRIIPAESDFTFSAQALAAAIAADRAAGLTPFLAIGTAGTINTGASDDLEALAAVCAREGLWFHVDGAFGAWARIAGAPWSDRVRGIEAADSVAFDFHKWLSVQYDAGCVLIRDGAAHRAAFAERPDYLARGKALAGGDPWPSDFGIDLSRGFRALKVWMVLKHHGTDQLGRMIAKNCTSARYLAARVARSEVFAVAAPITLNVVCFRLKQRGTAEADDAKIAAIVERLQLDGIAAPSTTRIGDRLCIRVAILNHRTEDSDLDRLLEAATAASASPLGGPH